MVRETNNCMWPDPDLSNVTQEFIEGQYSEVQQQRKVSRKRWNLKDGQNSFRYRKEKELNKDMCWHKTFVLETVKRPIWQEWGVYVGIKENIIEEEP